MQKEIPDSNCGEASKEKIKKEYPQISPMGKKKRSEDWWCQDHKRVRVAQR